MRGQRGHQLPRQAAAAVRLEHVDIGEVGEGGAVGDQARETDLFAVGAGGSRILPSFRNLAAVW